MILTLGINVIGIMSFFFYERQQRAAFLETRQSLETKLILEQESREQVSSERAAISCNLDPRRQIVWRQGAWTRRLYWAPSCALACVRWACAPARSDD